MKIITTYVFKCERQYSNAMWWCARFMINQREQARPSVGELYALILPFGCAFVYVMWIHLNNSLASWKMHKIILSIQWKWNAVFWWQCLWPMRLARPSQCESHAFSLSLSPLSINVCVFQWIPFYTNITIVWRSVFRCTVLCSICTVRPGMCMFKKSRLLL